MHIEYFLCPDQVGVTDLQKITSPPCYACNERGPSIVEKKFMCYFQQQKNRFYITRNSTRLSGVYSVFCSLQIKTSFLCTRISLPLLYQQVFRGIEDVHSLRWMGTGCRVFEQSRETLFIRERRSEQETRQGLQGKKIPGPYEEGLFTKSMNNYIHT